MKGLAALAYRFPDVAHRFPAAASFFATLLFFVIFYLLITPCWETNDDVGMSMRAHGYGSFIMNDSPDLIFSSTLWGTLVRHIPSFGGILGYSWATVASLFFACWAFTLIFFRRGVSTCLTCMVIVLIFSRPRALPQFTVNAGLLAAAAVLCLMDYCRRRGKETLLLFFLLSLLAYLIRAKEFIFVLLVALPLLPWRALIGRQMFLTIGLLALCLAGISLYDQHSKSGENWNAFNSLNRQRILITDFGYGRLLTEHPELLKKYGYTVNDILLLRSFFLVDPTIADSVKLSELLDSLDPSAETQRRFTSSLDGIKNIFTGQISGPLAACALLVAMAALRKRVFLSHFLLFASLLVLGAMGRPALVRIYYPAFSLLIAAPLILLSYETINPIRLRMLAIAVILCWVSIAMPLSDIALANKKATGFYANFDPRRVNSDLFFIWGNFFPYTSVFHVFQNDSERRNAWNIYAIASNHLAPNAKSWIEEKNGRGFMKRFTSSDGVIFLGYPGNNLPHQGKLIERFCQERFNGRLISESMLSTEIQALRLSCKQDNELSNRQ